jgi:hypothetical protein
MAFPKGALGALLRAVKREWPPSGFTPMQWHNLVDNLVSGNRMLDQAYRVGGKNMLTTMEGKPITIAHPEYAGAVSPRLGIAPVTQGHPFQVGPQVHMNDYTPDMVLYHSHPHIIKDPYAGMQYPAGLSGPDIAAMDPASPWAMRGVTSLEPEGGFGYAIRSAKAAPLERGLMGDPSSTWTKMEQRALDAARHGGKLHGAEFQLPRGSGELLGLRSDVLPEASLPSRFGVARALEGRGWIERGGYVPGTREQAETLDAYGPAIDDATEAADDYLTETFGSGRLGAYLLAALAGGGGALGALSARERAA